MPKRRKFGVRELGSRCQSDFFVRIRIVRKIGRQSAVGLLMLLVAPVLGFVSLAGAVPVLTELASDLGHWGRGWQAPALGAEPSLVAAARRVANEGEQLQAGPAKLRAARVSAVRAGKTPEAPSESDRAAKKPTDVSQAASEAGPESGSGAVNPAPPAITTLRIDRRAPRCEGIYVYIVSDWVDGEAMATIATGPNARGYPKRIGARVGEYEVIAIGPTTFGNGPAVWLARGDEVCRAMLFDDNPKRAQKRGKSAKRKRRKKRRRKR